jgi:hypothetical protein
MWRKSSRSDTGHCVEVRCDLAALRDSKQQDGPRLTVPGFTTFVKGVKEGRFDR